MASKKNYEVGFLFGAKKAASFDGTFKGISQSIGSVAKEIASIASAYVGVKALVETGKQAIESASSLEGYRSTLNVVLKDSQKAADTMQWAVSFANKTPFETDSVVEATVRLQAYGLQAQKVLPQIGDMAGVMNKDIMQAVEAVADAQTGELERLKEFGITKGMLIEQSAQMYRGIEVVNAKGQIVDREKFNNALFALMEDRFKGGMEIQAGSFKGLMSTVQGIWKTGLASMAGISSKGEIIDGSLFDIAKEKIKGVADTLQKMADNGSFEKIGTVFGKGLTFVIGGMQQIATVVIPIVLNLRDHTVKAFTWISDIAKESFGRIKAVASEGAEKFQTFGNTVGDALKKGFEAARPVIEWIAIEGLPKVISAVGFVAEKATAVYEVISGNWNTIIPVIAGITGAIAAYKVLVLATAAAEKIKTVATKFSSKETAKATIKQWALNSAVLANPTTWIIVGIVAAISALIAIGILLWKNWDTIKAKAIELWDGLKGAFGSAVGWFQGIWDGVVAGFHNFMSGLSAKFPMLADLIMVPINTIKGVLNGLKTAFTGIVDFVSGVFTGNWSKAWEGIKGIFSGIFESFASIAKQPINAVIAIINGAIRGINGLSINIPDWVPLVGGKQIGFSVPEIPMLARGGIATAPTLAMVGEGKESEAILPLSKLAGMLTGIATQVGGGGVSLAPIADLLRRVLEMLGQHPQKRGEEQIVYSPQIIIQGNASQEAVKGALDEGFEAFKRYMEQYQREKSRTVMRK